MVGGGARAVARGTVTHNRSYSYDGWGKVTCRGGTGLCTAMTYDPANNNRLSTIGSSPATYDAAGNLTSDGTGVGSHTYEWDAEGRVVSIDGLPGQACQATWIACYTYNALGQRAETAAGAALYEFGS